MLMLDKYTGTIRFKVPVGLDKRAIEKIFKYVSDTYSFSKFSIWKDEEKGFWVSSLTSSDTVVRQYFEYISQLNVSVLVGDPLGKVEVTGLIITKDTRENFT